MEDTVQTPNITMCSFSDLKECNEGIFDLVNSFCEETSRQSVKVADLQGQCTEAYEWLKARNVDVVYKDTL